MTKTAIRKTGNASLDELLRDSKPFGASNPEQSDEVAALLVDAANRYSENDIGNGFLALSRAMAMAALVYEKAHAENYPTSAKHKGYAAAADKHYEELTANSMAMMKAFSFYQMNRPFPVTPKQDY
jgi:hypothetical protein